MKNIVLLGTAPASMKLAPFGSSEWEIWACSPGTGMNVPRIDKFFELHRWEPGQPWFSEGYVSFLQSFPGEVIMGAHEPSVKNCKVLEVERLVRDWGPYNFTSSLAWMCAMAIEAEPAKIAFFGVDMAATSEYHDQRMGCAHFAVEAQKRGIEVGVPPESDLLRPPPLYGVCEHSHAWIKQTIRARELTGRLKQSIANQAQAVDEIGFLKGAMDDQDWQLHSFFGAQDSLGCKFTSPVVPRNDLPNRSVVSEVPTDPPLTGKAKVSTVKKRGRPRKK